MTTTKILLMTGLVALTGCGSFERDVAKLTGHSEQCVDGVMYLQFASGATVKYRPDGRVWTCGRAAREERQAQDQGASAEAP